jgi:hypothetical protein
MENDSNVCQSLFYFLEIKDKKEIDNELLGWIKEAYYLNYNN